MYTYVRVYVYIHTYIHTYMPGAGSGSEEEAGVNESGGAREAEARIIERSPRGVIC
jgi:hypothetical protein